MCPEKLLNHQEIYALVYSGNHEKAKEILHEQLKRFKKNDLEDIKIYLSAVNMGIYNYVLFKEHVSLHKCCINNQRLILKSNHANSIELGVKIIDSYAYSTDYMIEKHENVHIKKAIEYIHGNLSEPLTLDLLCENVNLNKCYLSNLFKQHVNCTFSEYLLKERIKLSKKLLINTNLSLNIIAGHSGFNNTSYFCTCFKKTVGISPCTYRNKFKK